VALAEADTDTDTRTLAWIRVDAFATAQSWKLMHVAWSANDWVNVGAMAASSDALRTNSWVASSIGSSRALIDSSRGSPSRNAFSVVSSLDLSSASVSSAEISSAGSVHWTSSEDLTFAAAHCPRAPAPSLPAVAPPAHAAPALA